MDSPKLPEDLNWENYIQKAGFFEAIIQQLNKDLGSFGPIKTDPNCVDAEDIKRQLIQILQELDALPGTRLLDLMYRVDVSSNQFYKGSEISGNERYVYIADLVLNREMKKVWFRMNFGQ